MMLSLTLPLVLLFMQRPFVICLLKKKLDENDVLICDEAEQNGPMNLTFDNEVSVNQNKEVRI